MSLGPGVRVGPFEVVSHLGAGGMGEVYRARDARLGREVALKTLPEALTRDAERRARLEREARLLASLNHPNVASLFGIEEWDGTPVLVMELVPGATLSERLARGPLPVREALDVARQVAEGLEAAHRKGMIHRDLKPANVKLTTEGRVKVLDFGLAKALSTALADDPLQADTASRGETDSGAVMGTAAYMSPEQARGEELDERTDMWSFGCLLYEMLCGKRAFGGATFSDTVAAVLDREPDWGALPRDTPIAALRLLRRCLKKQKDRRPRNIGDARLELEDLLAGEGPVSGEGDAALAVAAPSWMRELLAPRLAWLVLGAAAVGAGLWALERSRPPDQQPVVRMVLSLSPRQTIAVAYAPEVVFSPDGRQVVYAAASEGTSQLYLRTLDNLEARPIPGTEGGKVPFFSPDGRWLGFFAETERKLKKVPLSGGAPLTLCDVAQARGASWSPDGSIVFARTGDSGLDRVSADGGTPEVFTTLDPGRHESSHRLPEILPGGQAVVFTVKSDDTQSWDDARIEAVSLKTRERSVLIMGGTNARYAGGHLVYERTGALWAAPFDPARLKVTGPSALVLEGVWNSPDYGSAHFGLSRDGSLVYVPGKLRGADRQLVRVDRAGKARPLMDARRALVGLSLSPDGRRLALTIGGPNNQIWVYDMERSTLTPQTLRWNNDGAIWTPDGSRLTFTSDREGPSNLFWQPADGSGPAERLATSEGWQSPEAWSPDGNTLFFWDGADVWILQPNGDRKPRPFLRGPHHERHAAPSPSGRWLAYASDESGREEVYVRPFPGSGARWTISTNGGNQPAWARNGRELFYKDGVRMMAVTVTSDDSFTVTKPRLLFEVRALPEIDTQTYDVAANGDFLMIEPGESDSAPTQVNLVLNWLQQVRERVAGR